MSRFYLRLKAGALRQVYKLLITLSLRWGPSTLRPSFTCTIPTTVAKEKGTIDLVFFTPEGYPNKPTRSSGYPLLVNFHGGGFCIGDPREDAIWTAAAARQTNAVVVSVGYRLAPEYPFPIGLEDCVDALTYLGANAKEFALDAKRTAISGFSAGGNFSFSVPLRFQSAPPEAQDKVDLRGIVSFYPVLDYTLKHEDRLASNIRPETELPKMLPDLFDASYAYPAEGFNFMSPYVSPGLAPDDMIRKLPDDIVIYPAEWDGLRAEAEHFRDRLVKNFPEKRLHFRVIEGTSHGWDKASNRLADKREEVYNEGCKHLRRIFYDDEAPLTLSDGGS
ncbi:alpha/beta-hydrolase [Fistulina hepatica ATCC 64428]|uniref:Alpha/beta-hydrolase n=1 Tax=Fistulina hepatica ATCC 64428 TaxID=1128425 RepID=A0A0D7APQ2_9AGAR|nr:alpha/beta-hydrolase [Fistulina hepatica ATCC 64428]